MKLPSFSDIFRIPGLNESPLNSTSLTGLAGETATQNYKPHPNFAIVIKQDAVAGSIPGFTVTASMPDEFAIDTMSEWDTPFSDGLIPSRMLQTIAQVSGWAPTVQSMTAHFWKGSAPIDFTVPLTLVAIDSDDDLMRPLMNLKSISMASRSERGFMRAPGPQVKFNPAAADSFLSSTGAAARTGGELVAEQFGLSGKSADASKPDGSKMDQMKAQLSQATESASRLFEVKGKISIRIGRFLYFPDVIIRSLGEAYNLTLAPNGKPHKLTINVQATTRETPVFQDLAEMYSVSTSYLTGSEPDESLNQLARPGVGGI